MEEARAFDEARAWNQARVRRLLAMLPLAAVLLLGSFPESAAAQDDNGSESTEVSSPASDEVSTDTTTSTKIVDETPSSSDGSSTSAQPVEPTTTSATEVAPSITIATSDEATGADSSSTESTLDPLVDEGPTEDSLDPNVTVPPPSGAGVEVDFAPVPILWSNVREAEAKWAEASTARIVTVAQVRSLRLRAKELGADQAELETQTKNTIEELLAATERLQNRAVRGFVVASSGNPDAVEFGAQLFRSHDVLVQQRKARMIDSAVAVDQVSLASLTSLRSSLGSSALELVERSLVVAASLRTAEESATELGADVKQAKIELEAFKAGSDIYVDGVVFPIGGPYSVPLINSFGFPRMPGTADAHWHEGIDIFAPRGTPLVAAERAVVGRIGDGRLGGLKLWLRGESGADWYYAHLDGFAPGLHNGQVVEAGELLGYVGNTGNAVGTPPHLHLEIHPGGGAAVNPYPLLKVVSDLDLNSFVEGTHPGFRYQPVVSQQPDEPATTSTTATSTTVTTAAVDQTQAKDQEPSTTASAPATTAGSEPPATTIEEPPSSEPATTNATESSSTESQSIESSDPSTEPEG